MKWNKKKNFYCIPDWYQIKIQSNLFLFFSVFETWIYTNFVSKGIKSTFFHTGCLKHCFFMVCRWQLICLSIKSINNTRTVKQLVNAQENSELPNHYSFLPWATITGAWNYSLEKETPSYCPPFLSKVLKRNYECGFTRLKCCIHTNTLAEPCPRMRTCTLTTAVHVWGSLWD